MALIQKAFSDIITFSRSSNATRVGPTGLVEYAPHNLVLQSQTFDNASWGKSASSVTANSIAAPDGTVTADKLVEDSSASTTHSISQGSITVASSTVHTISFYAKAGERTWVACQAASGWTGGQSVYFDLSGAGAIGTINGTGTATITSVGNGWYRCTFTPPATTSTGAQIIIYLATGNGGASYTGNGTSGLYLWGAQLAVGPYPLDYTPTTSAAVYGPRFDFDPVTLAARGLLVEEQRTNLVTYSEQFDNAAWAKGGTGTQTVTANAGVAPDGTTTADQVTLSRSNASTEYTYLVQAITLASTAVHAGSVYMKAATSGDVGKQVALWQFDGAVKNVTLITLTADWQRYSPLTTSTLTSGANREPLCIGYRTTSEGGGTQTGSVSFFVWGAQAELGGFNTSYIPTLASTVTRSADVASVNTLSPWFNASTGTLYSEVEKLSSGVDLVRGAMLHDGSVLNRINSGAATSTGEGGVVVTGNVNQVAIGGSISTVGPHKLAFAYAANDFALSANGGAVSTDTSGTIPTVTTLGIGSLTSSYVGNGYVRRIAYYPRRLTNAELQALSA